MPQPHVNTFYRVWFTWVDPIVLLLTLCTCIFNKTETLKLIVPEPLPPIDALLSSLLHQAAALYGFMALMFAVLLRASSDPKVWRIVQAATLAVDVSLIVVGLVNLEQQGRLSLEMWRGIDWVNILFTVWVGLIRIGFLMGVGGGNDTRAKKEL
jgi:hypothetical protein